MGFLSAWDDTHRIDMSDLRGDPEGTWWVDVKKCLSHAEAERLTKQMMKSTIKISGGKGGGVRTQMSTDAIVDQQSGIVLESIVDWNLTDKNDVELPLEPHEDLARSLAMLPAPVYDRISTYVVPANTPNRDDEATFPDGGIELAEDGEDVPSDDHQVVV